MACRMAIFMQIAALQSARDLSVYEKCPKQPLHGSLRHFFTQYNYQYQPFTADPTVMARSTCSLSSR